MRNTLNTTFLFTENHLRISDKVIEQKVNNQQFLTVASISIRNRLFSIQKDFWVHPLVNDPANWDDRWFCNYE